MTSEERAKYTAIIREKLSDYRFYHSLCVSREAAELARLYGANEEKAELAGLLHDIMKEASKEEQLRLLSLEETPDDYLLASKRIWHAHSAAVYCRRELHIEDEEIYSAIHCHCSGKRGMSLFDKVIYTADFTSADRDYDDVELMRALSRKSLDDAMLYGLSYTISSLARENKPIHPDTVAAYNDILIGRSSEANLEHFG